jgi:hypothetical protein
MARKRGAPVLVELIKRSPTGAPSAADSVAPFVTSHAPPPPQPGDPRAAPGLAESAAWSRASSIARRNDLRLWALGLSGVIVLTVVGLWLGFRMGRRSGVDEWARSLPQEATPAWPSGTAQPAGADGFSEPNRRISTLPDSDPSGPTVQTPARTGASSSQPPSPKPAQTSTAPLPEEDFIPGHNYLVVATLPFKEATEVGEFLASKGLAAKLIPRGRVDLESAQTKNLPCEVIVLRGFAPEEFSSRAKEREQLMTRVKRLGRLWKAENRRAASDFADAWFKKF